MWDLLGAEGQVCPVTEPQDHGEPHGISGVFDGRGPHCTPWPAMVAHLAHVFGPEKFVECGRAGSENASVER